jgi:hypothetical protein
MSTRPSDKNTYTRVSTQQSLHTGSKLNTAGNEDCWERGKVQKCSCNNLWTDNGNPAQKQQWLPPKCVHVPMPFCSILLPIIHARGERPILVHQIEEWFFWLCPVWNRTLTEQPRKTWSVRSPQY